MLRRVLFSAFAGTLAVSISACDADRTTNSTASSRATAEPTATTPPAEIGGPLYKFEAPPPRPAQAPRRHRPGHRPPVPGHAFGNAKRAE